jgi:hypothetical protein
MLADGRFLRPLGILALLVVDLGLILVEEVA